MYREPHPHDPTYPHPKQADRSTNCSSSGRTNDPDLPNCWIINHGRHKYGCRIIQDMFNNNSLIARQLDLDMLTQTEREEAPMWISDIVEKTGNDVIGFSVHQEQDAHLAARTITKLSERGLDRERLIIVGGPFCRGHWSVLEDVGVDHWHTKTTSSQQTIDLIRSWYRTSKKPPRSKQPADD